MNRENNSGERKVMLTLTKDDYKTMMTALHNYGDYCLDAWCNLIGLDAEIAKHCGDRAFDLKGQIQLAWQKASKSVPLPKMPTIDP